MLPILGSCVGTPSTYQAATGGLNLVEFQLNLKYVDVGEQAASLLSQTLKDGKWFMKCLTYGQSSVSMPSSSQGTQ